MRNSACIFARNFTIFTHAHNSNLHMCIKLRRQDCGKLWQVTIQKLYLSPFQFIVQCIGRF